MRLKNLDVLVVCWQQLPTFAKDAYYELINGNTIDTYSESVWRNVLWYLEKVMDKTSPSDTFLREEVRVLQTKVFAILESMKLVGVG